MPHSVAAYQGTGLVEHQPRHFTLARAWRFGRLLVIDHRSAIVRTTLVGSCLQPSTGTMLGSACVPFQVR
jgi:hypothetical protein